ncbi:MAG: SPASM domain-containing protein, partial [Candidatus Bathyarchaeia archaeon]
MRQTWKAKPLDMSLDLYKKIAEESFSRLKRLVLYGVGEPFLNPNIVEMLRIAREKLPKESQIIMSTNGSLISEQLTDKIFKEIGVNSISFSIDTTDESTLRRIRRGFEPAAVTKSFWRIAKLKDKAAREFKLGVEAVIMEDNFKDLPNLVGNLAENNIDYIIVSHVVPYTQETYEKALYTTLSRPSLEIIKSSLNFGWRLIRESSKELLGGIQGTEAHPKSAELIREYWKHAEERGYWINIPLLLKSRDKIKKTKMAESIFRLCQKIAQEHQVDLKLPRLYLNAKERKCPYIEKGTAVVRSDGQVTPCLEFTYPHLLYINAHMKTVHEITFGETKREKIRDIWVKEAYANFRKTREKMVSNIPWCGDCPFSTLGCFYTKTNEADCHANQPGCSECLY